MDFQQFNLHPFIVKALEQQGFISPSPIQTKSIPTILNFKDLLCQAEAGSGKTLCFLIGILHLGLQLLEEKQKSNNQVISNMSNILPYSLIIVPTRELAIQIMDILTRLTNKIIAQDPENQALQEQFQPHLFIGGLPVENDRVILKTKRCSIIIGTIGRIMQMLQEKQLNLCKIKLIVLDEADKLHDNKVFEPHSKKILNAIMGNDKEQLKPQIICFSATYPQKVTQIIHKYLTSPIIITQEEVEQINNLKEFYIDIELQENKSLYQSKLEILINLLTSLKLKQTIVFYNDKIRGENLYMDLKSLGIDPLFIHGDLTQSDRIKIMNQLKRNKSNIIVSTDLLSRGIDVTTLDLVLHFDQPSTKETYQHRIGRTGRYGTFGLSIIFTTLQNGNLDGQINKWDINQLDEINKNLEEKHSKQQIKREYYAEFLNGVSEWKNKDYQLYDQSKFQYFEEPQVEKKIKQNDQIINNEGQQSKNISIQELDQIFTCKKCFQYFKTLREEFNQLEKRFII